MYDFVCLKFCPNGDDEHAAADVRGVLIWYNSIYIIFTVSNPSLIVLLRPHVPQYCSLRFVSADSDGQHAAPDGNPRPLWLPGLPRARTWIGSPVQAPIECCAGQVCVEQVPQGTEGHC